MSDPVPVYSNLSGVIPNGVSSNYVTVDIPDDMWDSWYFPDYYSGGTIHTPFIQASIDTYSDNNSIYPPGFEGGAPFIHVDPTVPQRLNYLQANPGSLARFSIGGALAGTINLAEQRVQTRLTSNYSSFSSVTVSLGGLYMSFIMGSGGGGGEPILGPNPSAVDS